MYQIELFGCTSAGKTTLTREVFLSCKQEGLNLVLASDYLLSRLNLAWIKHRIIRLIFIDSFCASACLLTFPKNFKLYKFCFRQIAKLNYSWITKLNLLRNIYKGIGTYEIINQDNRKTEGAVLFDGGTFQSIQPLFVHNNLPLDKSEIFAYSQLMSFPDFAIFFDQSVSVLWERIKNRGHKRINTSSDDMIMDFIDKSRSSCQSLIQIVLNQGWMSNFDSQPNILVSQNSKSIDEKMNRILEIFIEKLNDAQK
jgi:deoxyadenosine/deoxycytidine kinase